MATFHDSITFASDVTVSGTFTASGVPTLNGTTLLVNGDATAGTDQDPAIALLGGDGGSELIRTTLGQDSSADKAFIKMQGGSAGATEKSMTLHVGTIGTTAAVNSTIVLEAGASSTNKPASLVNTGSTGVLAITGTSGVTLSDSTATLSLASGALTATSLVSATLAPSGAATVNPAGAASLESSAAAINVGANAVAQPVNIGTGAAARVITVGNAASASLTLEAGVGALTVNADTGMTISNASSGNITIDNQAATGEIRVDLGTDTSATKFAVRNNSGTTLFSVDGAGTVTGAGGTVSRQVLERDAGTSQGSGNTNIIRFTNAVAAAGSGCFTFTDSAADGSYITASVNCMVTIAATVNRASGTLWIKSAASLSNSVSATDTDIKAVADFATANEGATATFYMAAGDRAWVSLSAAPGGSYARLNRLMVSAISI